METLIQARFFGYCRRCQFSVFRGERVFYNGTMRHEDCETALTDSYPRRLNPKYRDVWGDVSRKRVRRLLASGLASTGCEQPAGRGTKTGGETTDGY